MGLIKGVYVLALGVFLALFVGLGIAAFYPEPAPPPFPRALEPPAAPSPKGEVRPPEVESPEYRAAQEEFQRQQAAYQMVIKSYNQKVFFIAFGLGLAAMVVGLLMKRGLEVVSSGLLLGGTLTSIYGGTRYFGDMDPWMRFGVVALGLALLLFLGFRRLTDARGADMSRS
ncbi:MAG: hypothetical protein HY687_01215 [Chloroflexi bacterium]|nr:hypothetical protein [Chloroflexota bacterium]